MQDTGVLTGVARFDAATQQFLGFEVVKQDGPRSDGCPAIVAALS